VWLHESVDKLNSGDIARAQRPPPGAHRHFWLWLQPISTSQGNINTMVIECRRPNPTSSQRTHLE
jgi:hypothetical protein